MVVILDSAGKIKKTYLYGGILEPGSGGGGSTPGERENDWQAPYSYCGMAPAGSALSSPVWDIDRIEVFADGTVDVKSATSVAWTNRYIVIYT